MVRARSADDLICSNARDSRSSSGAVGPLGRQAGRLDLQNAPRLQVFDQHALGASRLHQRREHVRIEHVPLRLGQDDRAAPVTHGDEAALGQRALAFTDDAGAHPELRPQLAEAGEALSLADRSADDVAEQYAHHLAVER